MIRSLQACRAAAALLVVLFHTTVGIFALPKYFDSKPFGDLFNFGAAGVDFFFVLSGFIITHVHCPDLGRPERLRAYLVKRLTRIYPAYWVLMAALIPVFFLAPQFGTGRERQLDVIVCSLALVPHPHPRGPILSVAWSLVYEVFFYGLFATLIASRRWGAIVWAAWMALIAWPLFGACAPYQAFPWTVLGSLYHVHFLAGAALALAVRFGYAAVPYPRLVATLGALIFLGAGLAEVYVAPPSMVGRLWTYGAGSVLILAGLIQAERSGRLHTPSWLVFLGDSSYSIYLVHFPALSLLAKAVKLARLDAYVPGPLLFVLLAGTAVLAGCLFHVAVERPLLRYFRPQGRAAASPPPAVPERRSTAA